VERDHDTRPHLGRGLLAEPTPEQTDRLERIMLGVEAVILCDAQGDPGRLQLRLVLVEEFFLGAPIPGRGRGVYHVGVAAVQVAYVTPALPAGVRRFRSKTQRLRKTSAAGRGVGAGAAEVWAALNSRIASSAIRHAGREPERRASSARSLRS